MKYIASILCLAGCATAPTSPRDAACTAIQTPNQARDEATLQRIEHAWLAAELRGDTAFLQCLLLPDYVNIDKAGARHTGAEIIAHAQKNAGKDRELPPIESTIVVHGDAATAYSRSKTRGKDGEWRDVQFIDSFLFQDGAWHAYTGVDL